MFLDYPYLPTPPTVIEAALNLVNLSENQFFADLGSGEGDIIIQAAEKFNCFCIGFELNLRLILEAKRKIKNTKLGNKVEVVCADLFTVDLSQLDVLYVYPFPTITTRLSEKIIDECRKGAKLVTYDYPLQNLKLVKTVDVQSGMHSHRVFLYET